MAGRVDLYDDLSELYDLMVAWDSRLANEGDFFRDLFQRQNARRILDVACGTGMHAITFARWGYDAEGTDLSGEMVKRARANAHKAKVKVRFARVGFGQLRSKLKRTFDVVTCLGNSLPHLLEPDALVRALNDIYLSLEPGGVLVVQNRNYDKVWGEKNRYMPLEVAQDDGKEILFFRQLDFHQDTIGFNVITFTRWAQDVEGKPRWTYAVSSTTHRPLLKTEMESLLQQVGYVDLQFFGDYHGSGFDPSHSSDLIVLARRAR